MQKTHQQEQQQQQRLRNVSRGEAINRCLKSLIHALQCREGSDCPVAGCIKMKRIVEHTKKCHLLQSQKNPRDKRCDICSQLMQLCIFHTKLCRESCDAPFCRVMKRKLNEQTLDANGAQGNNGWVALFDHSKLRNSHSELMTNDEIFPFSFIVSGWRQRSITLFRLPMEAMKWRQREWDLTTFHNSLHRIWLIFKRLNMLIIVNKWLRMSEMSFDSHKYVTKTLVT